MEKGQDPLIGEGRAEGDGLGVLLGWLDGSRRQWHYRCGRPPKYIAARTALVPMGYQMSPLAVDGEQPCSADAISARDGQQSTARALYT